MITLEMTENEAHMCLEAVTEECVRFRKFIDRLEARGKSASPQASENMDALEYLMRYLKTKTGRL